MRGVAHLDDSLEVTSIDISEIKRVQSDLFSDLAKFAPRAMRDVLGDLEEGGERYLEAGREPDDEEQ